MVKNSIYRAAYTRKASNANIGYDYKDNILKNTLSSQLFGVNSTLDNFLSQLNKITYYWVEGVKQIKIFVNPALDKYETDIN